jgi:hypothetical protein
MGKEVELLLEVGKVQDPTYLLKAIALGHKGSDKYLSVGDSICRPVLEGLDDWWNFWQFGHWWRLLPSLLQT